jgi:hypothetical protein
MRALVLFAALAALTALAALAGCDWSLHRMQEPLNCPENGDSPYLPAGCNLPTPPGVVAMEAPEPLPPVTRALVERGRDRYERICAPCHGLSGDGDSQIARAMTLRRPPALIAAPVTQFSDDRLAAVIDAGYGVMPPYRSLLAPRDRFAVIQYLRVLQQRDVPLAELPAALQTEAKQWLR